ncbi:MAG: RimK family protein [Planctomycetes bacterium]|nr:RimK family protein [Planctomycetota bacterium]
MRYLVVVSDPKDWPHTLPNVEVVATRAYLTDPAYSTLERVRVVNLCRSMAYQKNGYYVSLLADARGHRPLPNIETIQNMKSQVITAIAASDVQGLIERSLGEITASQFVLTVYFGKNVARRHARLAEALFQLFPCPYMMASFTRGERSRRWRLESLKPLAQGDIPPGHIEFAAEATAQYLARSHSSSRKPATYPYDLAILVDPDEKDTPSNHRALQRFAKAGNEVGFNVESIHQEDYGRLAEFDALFIRTTTSVNHYTFRFACRAKALGIPVIDDPVSILRCANKVYLAELAEQQGILVPQTMIVHRGNVGELEQRLGLPCVLKEPDSAFSAGVVRVDTSADLHAKVRELLDRSDLVIAQGFVPTEFDWRVGVLDGVPLYACRYYMADGHWQIIQRDERGQTKDAGRAETLPVEQAPTRVIKTAVKAANHIGRGLYGVDLKEVGGKVYMIEVNDNPNIDAGFEDAILGQELYLRIMRTFLNRVLNRHVGAQS